MPRGRPITEDVKNNNAYFVNYYHKTKKDVICECGAMVCNHHLAKHRKTEKHIKRMTFHQEN